MHPTSERVRILARQLRAWRLTACGVVALGIASLILGAAQSPAARGAEANAERPGFIGVPVEKAPVAPPAERAPFVELWMPREAIAEVAIQSDRAATRTRQEDGKVETILEGDVTIWWPMGRGERPDTSRLVLRGARVRLEQDDEDGFKRFYAEPLPPAEPAQ